MRIKDPKILLYMYIYNKHFDISFLYTEAIQNPIHIPTKTFLTTTEIILHLNSGCNFTLILVVINQHLMLYSICNKIK